MQPDPSATFRLFDRVVNVRENIAVPLGLRGTGHGHLQGTRNETLSAYNSTLLVVYWGATFIIEGKLVR
ncbi:hypothetical protein HPB47_017220 [Ixodes persulcatus]|uniref:Uncharacterized protein n=1 Tax=Ixodes persulcatus TaxID=34615 RepID=A0AC60QNV5_IXOPE|nr:hypothetical protein HPB47_017220 [Ixodes persulcatus]